MQSCESYRVDPSNVFSIFSWSAFTSACINEKEKNCNSYEDNHFMQQILRKLAPVCVTISAVFSFKSLSRDSPVLVKYDASTS